MLVRAHAASNWTRVWGERRNSTKRLTTPVATTFSMGGLRSFDSSFRNLVVDWICRSICSEKTPWTICGSSSLKFQVIETDYEAIEADADVLKAKGSIERIGSQALISLGVSGRKTAVLTKPIRDHKIAVEFVLAWLLDPETSIPGLSVLSDIDAVGHRVVHGGEQFSESVIIDGDIVAGIERCIELAGLLGFHHVQAPRRRCARNERVQLRWRRGAEVPAFSRAVAVWSLAGEQPTEAKQLHCTTINRSESE